MLHNSSRTSKSVFQISRLLQLQYIISFARSLRRRSFDLKSRLQWRTEAEIARNDRWGKNRVAFRKCNGSLGEKQDNPCVWKLSSPLSDEALPAPNGYSPDYNVVLLLRKFLFRRGGLVHPLCGQSTPSFLLAGSADRQNIKSRGGQSIGFRCPSDLLRTSSFTCKYMSGLKWDKHDQNLRLGM